MPQLSRSVAFLAVAAALSFFPASCRKSSTLTRDKVATLIEKSGKAITNTCNLVEPASNSLAQGIKKGLWRKHPSYVALYELTEKGRQYFRDINGYRSVLTFKNVQPVKVVKVTGIAEATTGAGMKEASFWYAYETLPQEITDLCFAGPYSDGIAVLRLYDDGWRVEELGTGEPTA